MKKIKLKKYVLMFALFLGATVGFSQVYEGDLVITTQSQITAFNDAGFTKVEGIIRISSSGADYPKSIIFNNLEEIGGFSAITTPHIETISFPVLETMDYFSLWAGHSPLKEVDFPNLKTLTGWFEVSTNYKLEKFSMPKLEYAENINFSGNNPGLELVDFPLLVSAGSIVFVSNSGLNDVRFPALESVGHGISFYDTGVLDDLEFSSLISVGDKIFINGNPELLRFSVPLLTSSHNGINIVNNQKLTDLCGLTSAIESSPEDKFSFFSLGYDGYSPDYTYTPAEILDLNSDCADDGPSSSLDLSEVLLSTIDETCTGNDGTVTLNIPGYEAGSVDVSTPGVGSIVVPGTQVYWSAVNMTSGVLHVEGTAVFYGDLTIGSDVVGLIEGTVSVYGNLTIAGKVHNLGTIQATGSTTVTGSLYNEANVNLTNLVIGSVTSGSPAANYSVVWEDGFEGITRSDLSEGTYIVTVTNLEGESGEIEVVVGKDCVVHPGPTVVTPYPNPVSGVGDLTIQVTLPADEPNFELRLNSYWGTLLNEVYNGPLSAGEYTFTINIPNEGFYLKYLQYSSNGGSGAIMITRMPY